MKTLALLLLSFSLAFQSLGQDCSFMPPDGYTLYTTSDPLFSPPSLTGFISASNNLSGSWSLTGSTGTAGIMFSDNDGRSTAQSISGAGTITIQNEVTDINPPNNMSTCVQTFDLTPFVSSIGPNRPLASPCPLNIVVVIDESESIASNMTVQIVRDAVFKLASKLSNSESKMAIVEFDSQAEIIPINGIQDLQIIDEFYLNGLVTYLNTGYNPMGDPINLIGGTNWEDALRKANTIAGADYILLLTDGRPTFYSTSAGMNGIAGEGLAFDLTSLKEAQDAANLLKSTGKHLFVAGIDFPSDLQPIVEISGNKQYLIGEGIDALLIADYSIVPPGQLVSLFEDIARLCPDEIVPTMSEWSVIICGLLMAIFAVVGIKNQEKTTNTVLIS